MSKPFVMPPLPPITRDGGHSVFVGYDSGPYETPYCCSFHWLRLPDGRVLGLDVVRSGDTGRQALRLFVVEATGAVTGFVVEGPDDTFAPFATDEPPTLDAPRVLGRGEGWIAGYVTATDQAFSSVRFSLRVEPECLAHSTKELFDLDLVYLASIDYTRVHTAGYVELDGTRFEVDAIGPVSVHVGERLPPYGYAATVPFGAADEGPTLLLASVSGEDVRFLGFDLRETVFTYGLGSGSVPARVYSLRDYAPLRLPVGLLGRIALTDVQTHVHRLLGEETITASADAVMHLAFRHPIALGRIVLDVRGAPFATLVSGDPADTLD